MLTVTQSLLCVDARVTGLPFLFANFFVDPLWGISIGWGVSSTFNNRLGSCIPYETQASKQMYHTRMAHAKYLCRRIHNIGINQLGFEAKLAKEVASHGGIGHLSCPFGVLVAGRSTGNLNAMRPPPREHAVITPV